MPYITASEFKMVRHLIEPHRPSNDTELLRLERDIFALNKQIKALPDEGPTPTWHALIETHRRMLAAYRAAGGKRL